jgi:hypothetical protein
MAISKRIILVSILALSSTASATSMVDVVCGVIGPIWDAIYNAGGTIVLIMFLYGGLKYVFSADDPGGRKQAKNILIHTIIAGILLAIAGTIMGLLGITQAELCSTVTLPP